MFSTIKPRLSILVKNKVSVDRDGQRYNSARAFGAMQLVKRVYTII
jgi:hypothetical protein